MSVFLMLLVYRRNMPQTFIETPCRKLCKWRGQSEGEKGRKNKTQRFVGDRKTNAEIGQMYGKEGEEEKNAH